MTFTDKAAGEMVDRLRARLPGVTARTFHAHALSQLRFFWPLHHDGAPLPELLDSKLPLLVRIRARLPGHYRFTPAKDLADEIEWAKSRRSPPADTRRGRGRTREPPIPVDLFVRSFADYERAKARAGRIDFDDLLDRTIDLLETRSRGRRDGPGRGSAGSASTSTRTRTRSRSGCSSCGRRSSTTCASSATPTRRSTRSPARRPTFLEPFADRHPGARVVDLTENYRSTPEVLELANRLLGAPGAEDAPRDATGRARARRSSGTRPTTPSWLARRRIRVADRRVARSVRDRGPDPDERPARADRGGPDPGGHRVPRPRRRVLPRPDVRAAIDHVRRSKAARPRRARRWPAAVRAGWARDLGFEDAPDERGNEARERGGRVPDAGPGSSTTSLGGDAGPDAREGLLEALTRRASAEQATRGGAGATGVELATYHRAKGLEWDAVFLPMLEEGSLPIRQAFDDEAALDEERRLLYVGITRARTHLALSWAERRDARRRGGRGGGAPAEPVPRRAHAPGPRPIGDPPVAAQEPPRPHRPRGARVQDTPVMAALREWRWRRAADDGVPAFVVAHDTTLRAIAEARPATLAALEPRQGHGTDEARPLRRGDPRGDRLGDMKRPRASPGAWMIADASVSGTIVFAWLRSSRRRR